MSHLHELPDVHYHGVHEEVGRKRRKATGGDARGVGFTVGHDGGEAVFEGAVVLSRLVGRQVGPFRASLCVPEGFFVEDFDFEIVGGVDVGVDIPDYKVDRAGDVDAAQETLPGFPPDPHVPGHFGDVWVLSCEGDAGFAIELGKRC